MVDLCATYCVSVTLSVCVCVCGYYVRNLKSTDFSIINSVTLVSRAEAGMVQNCGNEFQISHARNCLADYLAELVPPVMPTYTSLRSSSDTRRLIEWHFEINWPSV